MIPTPTPSMLLIVPAAAGASMPYALIDTGRAN